MRKAWLAGIVLGGSSAGGICWFEGGTTDSFGRELRGIGRASCRGRGEISGVGVSLKKKKKKKGQIVEARTVMADTRCVGRNEVTMKTGECRQAGRREGGGALVERRDVEGNWRSGAGR